MTDLSQFVLGLAYMAWTIRAYIDTLTSFLENYQVSGIHQSKKLLEIASHLVDIEELIDPSYMVETITDTHMKSELNNLVSFLSEFITSIEILPDIDFSLFAKLLELSKKENRKKYHMYRMLMFVRKMSDVEKAKMPRKQFDEIARVVGMLRLLRLHALQNYNNSFLSEIAVCEIVAVLDQITHNQLIVCTLSYKDINCLEIGLCHLKDCIRDMMEPSVFRDNTSLRVSFMCWSYSQIEMICIPLDITQLRTTEAFGGEKHILTELLDESSGDVYTSYETIKKSLAENHFNCNEEKLDQIGRSMAHILRQYPLARKMIGRVLCVNPDARYWEGILDEVAHITGSELKSEENKLLELIGLCYNQLPAPMCCCFTYCSLFPRDWMFEPETIMQLWISQGFISTNNEKGKKSNNETANVHDVARMCFMELVSRSFFEPLTVDGYMSYYTMHPVVHNLAEIMSGKVFLRIGGNYKIEEVDEILRRKLMDIHHLSITADKLSFLEYVQLDELITLIILDPSKSDASYMVKKAIIKLKIIRTLYLPGCVINDFHEAKCNSLDNLRYLNLSDTGICGLPWYFNKLYLLEVLNLQGCSLEYLPKDIICLENLQHIIAPNSLIYTLHGIGKLTKLQELEEFQVGNQDGLEISQLSGLSMLGGSLSITNLENVHNENEASLARLSEKTRLNTLKLEWSPESETNSDILDQLKPPFSIEVLEIKGYSGSGSPHWLQNNWLQKVVEISFTDCMNWESLPPMGSLPHLKLLKLYNLPSVEKIGLEFYSNTVRVSFPSLEEIFFEHMPNLRFMFTKNYRKCFPHLRRFIIRDCPLFRVIPVICYEKLTEVVTERVGLTYPTLEMPKRGEESTLSIKVIECPNVSSINGVANGSVTELILQKCPELSTIAPSIFLDLVQLKIIDCAIVSLLFDIKVLYRLQELHVLRCPQVTIENSKGGIKRSPPPLRIVHTDKFDLIGDLKGVPLQVLTIEDCPRLESLNKLMEDSLPLKTLNELCLTNCENLKSLPRNMKAFSSLERLILRDCAKISSLPVLPSGLEKVQIIDCPILEKRCQVDGPDWNKISHIPYKSVE